MRSLGADEMIDYNKVRFEQVVRDADVILDTMAGDTQKRSWLALKKGGILVSILMPPPKHEADRHGARAGYVLVRPNASQLSEIAALIEIGALRPVVETVLPLSEARHAQEISQTGHVRGKIVLRVV